MLLDNRGKVSSKRVSGMACMTFGLAMGACTGFPFYEVSTELVLTILGNGTLLLGAGVMEKPKTDEPQAD